MSVSLPLQYGVSFGKCDSSDWIDWEIVLTAEEEAAYLNALKNRIALEDVPELSPAVERAYAEIEEEEISRGLELEDEYVMECQGTGPMDPDELNDLVADRDPHAMDFFGLDEASAEDWDANDLEELPSICDFNEDFTPYSPFDEGWSLYVEFIEPDYDDEREQKRIQAILRKNA